MISKAHSEKIAPQENEKFKFTNEKYKRSKSFAGIP